MRWRRHRHGNRDRTAQLARTRTHNQEGGRIAPALFSIQPVIRLFIAGHSDSDDTYLPAGVLPWPERLRLWIESESGQECERSGVRFAPVGPRAVSYLMDAVSAAQPDILILPFGAYVFTIGTVEESVRQRFGVRARDLYLKAEQRFQRATETSPPRVRVNKAGRRFTRTVLGTRTMTTVERAGDIYEEVLHRLTRVESLQVVTIADARFSAETQARNPRLNERIDALHRRLLPIVAQHHLALVELEGVLRAAPDRSVYYHPDGVHTTEKFHDVYFSVLQEAIRPLLPRLAPPA